MAEDQGRELGWDDTISEESEFIVLPEGEYEFQVMTVARDRHTPNAHNPGKLPSCNKAVLEIKILSEKGNPTVRHNLFLHTSVEGMVSAFFRAIGQKKKGEPLKMNWPTVPGSKGRAKVGIRKYKTNDGDDREINEIRSFLPMPEKPAATYQQGSF